LTASFFLLEGWGNEGDVKMLNAAEIAALENNIDNVWSLADYLSYLNADARKRMAETPGLWCSEFTEDLSHWAEVNITTARDLANYLDACFQREVQKSMYDYDRFDDEIEASRKEQARRDNVERRALKAQYVNVAPEPNNAIGNALLQALGVKC